MPLPRKLLTEGESVIVEIRPTWLVLGWPLVVTIAAAALAVLVVVAFPKAPVGVGYVLLAIVLVAAGWLGIRALKWHTTSIVLTTSRILERKGVFTREGIEIRLDRVNELSYRQTLIERIVHTGSLELEVGGETGVVIFNHLPHPAAVQSLVTEQIDAMRRGRTGWQMGPGPPGVMGPGGGIAPPGSAQPAAGFYPQPSYPQPSYPQPSYPQPSYQQPSYAPPAYPQPAPGAPPAAGSAGQTVADRLMQLDQLRQRGILSESEFQAKKAELLQQL
jgi:hypothetical protein